METREQQPDRPADGPQPNEFDAVKTRLEEIARAVDDENLPLDDALDLYEEAVTLGLRASDLLEVGIEAPEEATTSDHAEDAGVASETDHPATAAGAVVDGGLS